MAKGKSKEMRKIENLMESEKPNRLRSINSLSSKLQEAASDRSLKKAAKDPELQKSTNAFMSHLARLTGTMADQAKNLSMEVARSTAMVTKGSLKAVADASVQFGRQVGQDVNWNKQAIIAQALSKASPIFGHFAAKFMETDVFKKAAENIKMHIGGAFKNIGEKFGTVFAKGFDKVRGLFGGSGSANNIKKNFRIPSMAVGGYVAKEGLINVHPAEVIMPIDKVMQMINQRASGESSFQIGDAIQRLTSMNKDYMDTYQKDKKDNRFFMRTFLDSLQTQNEDMLIEIKRSLAGNLTIGKQISMAFQKTLELHPGFRAMVVTGRFFEGMVTKPIKFFFGRRGHKWASDLPKDKQPLTNQMKTLHVIYTGMMWQFESLKSLMHGLYVPLRDMAMKIIPGSRYPATIQMASKMRQSIITRVVGGAVGGLLEFMGMKGAKNYLTRDLNMKTMLRTLADPMEWFANKKLGKKNILSRNLSVGSLWRWNRPKLKLAWRMFKSQKRYSGENAEREATVDSAFYAEAQAQATENNHKELVNIRQAVEWQVRDQKRKNIWAFITNTIWPALSSAFNVVKDSISGMFEWFKGGNFLGALTGMFGGKFGAAGLSGVAKIAGMMAGPLAAAGVGVAIGTTIYEKFIKPKQDALYKKLDEQTASLTAINDAAIQNNSMKTARTGNRAERGGAIRELDIASQFDISDAKSGAHAYGLFTDASLINAARKNYMLENMDLYRQYSPEEIARVRAMYYSTNANREYGYSAKSAFSNPKEYGSGYEKHFANFLAKNGKISEIGLAPARDMLEKGQEMFDVGKGKVIEIGGKMMSQADLARQQVENQIDQLDIQRRSSEKLSKMSESLDAFAHAVSANTNVVTTSVSNMSNSVVNQGGQAMSNMREKLLSSHTVRALQGEID